MQTTHSRRSSRTGFVALAVGLASAVALSACIEDEGSLGADLVEDEDLENLGDIENTENIDIDGESPDEVDHGDARDDAGTPAEPGPATPDSIDAPNNDVTVGLLCSQNNDCHEYCDCVGGTCVPDGFGPPPEGDVCNTPPVRTCNSSANCQSGCTCSGGICQSVFSPYSETCHLPPPDTYENDDTWQKWKAYTGSPQVHNLHSTTDEDWVAVYFAVAGTYRFQTTGLSVGTDTVLEVYAYANGGKGALAGSNDNVGGAWWDPNSKGSRVTLGVPANSSYLIRVDNKSASSIYRDSYEWPRYTLQVVSQ
ncbi:hypothetical protein ENSA7_68710 [Enhygromyxa salina]|uniref:Uncharacterized protein n=1 Tax=Enhygromyxa salina TaxID=215803 RepID=A0A2S9XT62_9BACT|nr:hypothetical protein ENSA7_68710 [Enhygromyxa salina]